MNLLGFIPGIAPVIHRQPLPPPSNIQFDGASATENPNPFHHRFCSSCSNLQTGPTLKEPLPRAFRLFSASKLKGKILVLQPVLLANPLAHLKDPEVSPTVVVWAGRVTNRLVAVVYFSAATNIVSLTRTKKIEVNRN